LAEYLDNRGMKKRKPSQKELDNLKKFDSESARAAGAKGGRASGKARARKRSMAELASVMMRQRLQGEQADDLAARFPDLGGEVTQAAAVVAGQVAAARKGSTQAFNALREMEAEQDARDAESGRPFERDFVRYVGPAFWPVHYHLTREDEHEFWMPGGRGSGKSSAVSQEIVAGMMAHQDRSAYVFQAVQGGMEGGPFEQVRWAIDRLGVSDAWECRKAPLMWRVKDTGQVIRFKGLDDAGKTKATKAPTGTYYAYQWFEEVDQLDGPQVIRTALQSLTRDAGGDAYFARFYTFNPPRVAESWANRLCQQREDKGKPVYRSTFYDLPPEWVTDQMREDAEALKETDPDAYRHEYLGESVGIGGLVFDRAEFRRITDDEVATFDDPMVGQDFGWWPDPWAMTVSEWRPAQRTLLTWREDGGNKLTPQQSAGRARKLLTWRDPGRERATLHQLPVWSDDADPQQIAQQRDAGLDAHPAGKGAMRMASYRWLSSVRWVIDPERCPRLADEVRRKQYERLTNGSFVERIPDGDDHWIDATRYATMRLAARRTAYR
jgi:phage terminase large subunit